MTDPESNQARELREILARLGTRLRRLTVAVVLMALAMFLLTATLLGELINWFAGQPSLFGGATVGAAVLGFAFGWFAGKRV